MLANVSICIYINYYLFIYICLYFSSLIISNKMMCFRKQTTIRPKAAVSYLYRQVAAHSTGMGVQGRSGEQAHPAAGGLPGRSSGGSLQPGSEVCGSWGSRRWEFQGDCRAQTSQLELKGRKN